MQILVSGKLTISCLKTWRLKLTGFGTLTICGRAL
jgi:hypothetical protein